jgi:hypothetical protein
LFVDPLPPGAIDTNASNFHPEKLYLKWTAPGNSTFVDRYTIYIDGNTWTTWTNEGHFSYRLEPGRNYTVKIVAESWYSYSYGRRSKPYTEQIETLRE